MKKKNSMKKLVILGGRGIGMIAASVAQDLGTYNILGFLNDFVPIGNTVGVFKKHKAMTPNEFRRDSL